jgi:hypothetical protein
MSQTMSLFDERAFIERLEAAGVEELAHLLSHPRLEEERALRTYLGDERYQRLHARALRQRLSRGTARPRGNVVVIHGMMGSELTAVDRAGSSDPIWLHVLRIVAGRLEVLRLSDDGRSEYDPGFDVRASGILKRAYGELLLALALNWNVRAFWFDWRKDLKLAAAELDAQISGWFDDDAPVHLVAHSMGGLVARTFIQSYPRHWAAMWDTRSPRPGALGGRLIMLGTPNHGSFSIPQAITGVLDTVQKLAWLDLRHSLSDLLTVLNSFVGTYQMLPSPLVLPAMEPLYRSETYGDLNVPQRLLDTARRHHELLAGVVDPECMISIAGDNQPTYSGITDFARLRSKDAYEVTFRGDGSVPHHLSMLKTSSGALVPAYYVTESHGNLPSNDRLLGALDELLLSGTTSSLSTSPASARGAGRDGEAAAAARLLAERERADTARVQSFVERMRTRESPGIELSGGAITAEERAVEEIVTRHFLGSAADLARPAERPAEAVPPPRIEVGLVLGDIEAVDYDGLAPLPVDAIAVGHYQGVKPQAAELALDRALSQALLRGRPGPARRLRESDLLLTQYSERGTIRGELGQPFFLSDPRTAGKTKSGVDRVIAVCGMGVAGRFGMPELTVLARELCWALGLLGKRHLATVLIGAGNGNIAVRDAVSAWLRGIAAALTGSAPEDREEHRLARVTFVERDPSRIERMHDTIRYEQRRLAEERRLEIAYDGEMDEARRKALREAARELERRAAAHNGRRRGDLLEDYEPMPTRITLGLEGGVYRFGAITASAAVPERTIPLDPSLVEAASGELAAEGDRYLQVERGQFLGRLLLPSDLRDVLATDAPIVMTLDATTARIPWELVAQTDPIPVAGEVEGPDSASALARQSPDGETAGAVTGTGSTVSDYMPYFLGTSRGFTRQLRTTFAPPPEPPPPPHRVLRVLVVADPAEDAHLAGAEEEGAEVADLFEAFNRVYEHASDNRVEVVRLLGPRQATRTNVLRHLMLSHYDVLHFAGHAIYDAADPSASGWVFTGGRRISANELDRIDRVPPFVFSNACESGVTPDRSELHSPGLAPSFAEAFFKRGVSNFLCTAWPVEDVAARLFAVRLYGGLLGLTLETIDGISRYTAGEIELMHVAMREARRLVAQLSSGIRTWGAYQHYGNPYFRFFDPWRLRRPAPAAAGAGGATAPAVPAGQPAAPSGSQ